VSKKWKKKTEQINHCCIFWLCWALMCYIYLQCHNLPTCTSYEITNIYIQIARQFTFTVPVNQRHPLNSQHKYIFHDMAIQETSQRVWWRLQ
jgi:hypothetical protein